METTHSVRKVQKRETHLHALGRQMWKKRQLYLLILPAVITVFIFHYMPIYGLQIAFKNFRSSLGIVASEWVGLNHFMKFLGMPFFWKVIRNTLSISLYSLATFPCSVILALLLNELNSEKFKKTVQMVTYAPHFISTVVVVSMLTLFMGRSNGLFNNIAEMLGGERIAYLEKPEYFSTIYVWSGVWQNIGWGAIIYIAALAGISSEMIEAAKIDGASRLKIVWYINIPSILPTIVTMLILNTGSILSISFDKIYLMMNSLNADASRVLSVYVYETGLLSGQFDYSAAIGLFNNVVNILFIMLTNQICKKLTKISMW